jgi:formate dehydrogenase maturation protein FdhE
MLLNLSHDLNALKAQLHAEIDHEAGRVRSFFITTVAGQELVYAEKRREAEALLADPALAEEATPHLTAEAMANQVTRLAKAEEIIATATAWALVSSQIEVRRLAAKAAVSASTSAAAARSAAAVDWADIIAMAPQEG